MDEIDKEKDISRTSEISLEQTRLALDERKSAFGTLVTKLSSTEAELGMSKSKVKDLESVIKKVKNDLDLEKNGRLKEETKHKKESTSAHDIQLQMESQITELERRNKSLQKKVKDLENQGDEEQQKNKKDSRQAEEKHNLELKKLQERYEKELNNMSKKHDEYNQTIKEKIERLEKERNKLEEEVSQLRSEVVSGKLKTEEEFMNLKRKLKHEELLRAKQYEERIDLLQTSRDELQNQSNKQMTQITDLQSQLSAYTRENEGFKRSAESLKQQLDQKEMENRNEINRSKLDFDSERKTQAELRDKIVSLESTVTDLRRRHMDEISLKDNEIVSLKEHLKNKEKHILKRQEEEMRRAELLESAIYNYVSSTKSASQPSSPLRL